MRGSLIRLSQCLFNRLLINSRKVAKAKGTNGFLFFCILCLFVANLFLCFLVAGLRANIVAKVML
jgi:hypothetical protein